MIVASSVSMKKAMATISDTKTDRPPTHVDIRSRTTLPLDRCAGYSEQLT